MQNIKFNEIEYLLPLFWSSSEAGEVRVENFLIFRADIKRTKPDPQKSLAT